MIKEVLSFAICLLIIGCSSAKLDCPDYLIEKNIAAKFNSPYDDLFPVIFGNTLYVLSNRESKGDDYNLYEIDINDYELKASKEFQFSSAMRAAQLCFYFDSARNFKELYFGALNRTGKILHSDIFYSFNKGDGWSRPVPLEINSPHFEAYPSISQDGRYLIFCSDRPGSIGEIDIYISERIDGKWSEPKNVGSIINTIHSEINPHLSDGKLFFSSNLNTNNGYDLFVSEFANGVISNPRKLQHPFNSNFDEKSPYLYNNMLFFSSNRPEGCGGYDIYAYQYCLDAVLELNVNTSNQFTGNFGTFTIKSGNDILIDSKILNKSSIKIKLLPEHTYEINYKHPCLKEKDVRHSFFIPCSDTAVLKYVYNIEIPDIYEEFTFEEYKVPFFVTGYYLPNTKRNLETLRMKFSYNLIGNTDSTRYIENPGSIYDEYAPSVEKALEEAKAFIIEKLTTLKGECVRGDAKLEIKLYGYADPRSISPLARYDGPQIDDPDLKFKVARGEVMTNDLLSKLRAYFTADHIRKSILSEFGDIFPKDKVKWRIEGKGIDETPSLAFEYKRRVSISISIK